MWRTLLFTVLVVGTGRQARAQEKKDKSSFYDFSVKSITGETVPLAQYRGKVSLVVNVASECGFTDNHYRGLVKMQKLLGETQKFTVLAFPCNQFGNQEPKENDEIKKFAEEKYDVNFPMFAKINVLEHEVPEAWNYIISRSGYAPNWNFWKYLVNPEGKVEKFWGPWSDVEEVFPDVKKLVDQTAEAKGPHSPFSSRAKASVDKNGDVKPPASPVQQGAEPPIDYMPDLKLQSPAMMPEQEKTPHKPPAGSRYDSDAQDWEPRPPATAQPPRPPPQSVHDDL